MTTRYETLYNCFHALIISKVLPPSVMSIVEEVTATYVSLSIPLPSLPDVEQYQVQLHLAGDGGFGAAIGEPVTIDRSVCPRVEFGNLRPDSLYEVVTSVIVGGRRTQGTVVGVNTSKSFTLNADSVITLLNINNCALSKETILALN